MVSVLALLSFCPVTWTAEAQETDKHDPTAMAPQGVQLTFRTMDDNTQQVNPDEIWRIRGAATSDEPPGSIVIDYAFERLYVKDSLANVVEKVSGIRPAQEIHPAGRGAGLYRPPAR